MALAVGILLAGALTAASAMAQRAPAFTPRDESPDEFPSGTGREETFYACTPCHNFKLVASQGQTRRQWDETLAFMTQRHNMPPLEGADRKLVLDYLEATFPPRASRGGFQNPFQR